MRETLEKIRWWLMIRRSRKKISDAELLSHKVDNLFSLTGPVVAPLMEITIRLEEIHSLLVANLKTTEEKRDSIRK